AEDFDNGGEGVSWHDMTSGNLGGFYRTNTDVDIIAPTGNATGAVVNNFQTGEWLEYTISVAQAGTCRLEAHVSSEFSTSRWHGEGDGVNVTGSLAVPNTGFWGTFQSVGVPRPSPPPPTPRAPSPTTSRRVSGSSTRSASRRRAPVASRRT